MSNKKTLEVKLTDRDLNYKKVFNSDAGQRVLEDLKAMLKHGQNIYHIKQENRDLHYELGRQSVINDILFILSKGNK
jgi:hypothetical protein